MKEIKDCSVTNCTRPAFARGWCKHHYQRWYTYGTTSLPVKLKNPCKVDKCEQQEKIRQMCLFHYGNWARWGDPQHICKTKSFEERFWEKVVKSDNIDGCWLWTGYVTNAGYGQILWESKMLKAHRASWFIAYGYHPIQCILHSCDTKLCVNPAHLREGSHKDNMQDALSRNRFPIGEDNYAAILTNEEVRKIKDLLKQGNLSQTEIGTLFNVSNKYIFSIKVGKSWKNIT